MKDAGVPLQPAGTSALVRFTKKNSNRTNRNHHFHFLLIFQGTNNFGTRQSAAAESWAWIWNMNAVFTSRTGSGSARSGPARLGPARPGSARSGRSTIEALFSPRQLNQPHVPTGQAGFLCSSWRSPHTSSALRLSSCSCYDNGWIFMVLKGWTSVCSVSPFNVTNWTKYLIADWWLMQIVTVKREITSVITSSPCADGESAEMWYFMSRPSLCEYIVKSRAR